MAQEDRPDRPGAQGARPPPDRPLSLRSSLSRSLSSWRVASVTALSFSSGFPLGFVLSTVPFWMQQSGVDIKAIGLVTAAQIPYAFKFVWSPLMDRYAPRRGRKRAWIALGQLLLAATTLGLASTAGRPSIETTALFLFLISFASATQDIAVDAYAVEALRTDEQGVAVGARTAIYRAAMYVSGSVLVSLGPALGWAPVFVGAGLVYVPFALVTLLAPEPEVATTPPRSLRAAVWEPFVGFLRQPRALEIAGFVLLYKAADNLAGALVRPFLGELGYSATDVGVAMGTIGLAATLIGTFVGGVFTTSLGVGRALWVFGVLQMLSNVGYAAVAQVGVDRTVMYLAVAVEAGVGGMGTGAFGVLLLRLTERRFSATQYALFSSIFALGRTLAGPFAGLLAHALGWRDFFLLSLVAGVPGLLVLQRFVPWRERDIPAAAGAVEGAAQGAQLRPLLVRGACGLVVGTVGAFLVNALLVALRQHRAGAGFDLSAAALSLFAPRKALDWVDLVGPVVAGVLIAIAFAAWWAARSDAARADAREAPLDPEPPR